MSQRGAGQRVELLLAILDHLHLLAADHLASLQGSQDVRHADVREDHVVHAPRTLGILVERTQVAVQPVGATYAGDQGQVRRSGAEPGLGVGRLHADIHVIADLGAGEYQLFHHQVGRNAQVGGDALVTLELGAMTAHAVVGEGTRAILHGRLVGQVDIDMVQLRPMAAGGETQDWQYRQDQCSELLFHQPVTLSGTGLVFSIRV